MGVNFTLIVQKALAERIDPQLLVSVKSHVGTMLVMLKGASPGLLNVTDCNELLVPPMGWPPKPRLAVESEAWGSRTPVPVVKIT